MKDSPVVSIIIPSYNRPDFLERLLESITKISYTNIEVVIVDDNSTCDYSSAINYFLSKIHITYIKNERNLYAEKSRKKGFASSTGQYVVFCDDDDYYYDTDFLKKAVKLLIEHDNLSFVSYNAFKQIQPGKINRRNDLNVQGFINGYEYIRLFQIGYNKPLSTFTTIFRRESLVGENAFFNDSSLYLYALTNGDAYIINTEIGYYTIHSSNITSNIKMDFIFDVLDSKYYIHKIIKSYVSWDTNTWWEKQLYLTSKFYLRSGTKTISDFNAFRKKVVCKYNYNAIKFFAFCVKEFLCRKRMF